MTVPKLDKRKHTARTWLNRLFGARRIDFVAPVSLETSAKLIQTQMPEPFGDLLAGYAFAKVSLTCLDEDTYQFQLFRIGFRGVAIRGAGYLKREQADETYVSVKIRPAYEVIVASLVFVGIFMVHSL